MDKIIIRNMKFFAYHGVLPSERKEGQFFHIDLEMYTDLSLSGKSDDLSETIDYSEAFNLISEINKKNKFNLIEKLAETIADTLLKRYNCLEKIQVSVRKPEAPIKGSFDWVGVELIRGR
jgi:dihydroneopterin aldolase